MLLAEIVALKAENVGLKAEAAELRRRLGQNSSNSTPQRLPMCDDPAADQRFADGTSWQEIGPDFFQPSRRSHVRGWYTTSGS